MSDDVEERRAGTARLIYEEATRLRSAQDHRVNDVRQRSITVLSLVSSAVVIVVGLTSDDGMDLGTVRFAAAAVACMILSGVVVHLPLLYNEGPNIHQLTTAQYNEAHPAHQTLRDLATYHYDHYLANNHHALRWINWGFRAELVFAAAAVLGVLIGVSV